MDDDFLFSLNEDEVSQDDFDLASELEETLKLDVNLENVEESTIDLLLEAVRAQYISLEKENSRLLKLSSLIQSKIEDCSRDMAGAAEQPPFFALDLDIKPDVDVEEESEDDDVP